jgi:hypothetical protein
MSQDFKKVLVNDDRLNVTDSINYAVHKGGQNMTAAQFNAISQSNTSHTYNIQVPSEQTLIDRRVLWQSTVILALQFGTVPTGQLPFSYGYDSALAPFPLHQLASVMTATINNNAVSLNIRDVLPAMLRFNDSRELQRYNGYTPTMWDNYLNYADGVGANNNPLGGFNQSSDMDLLPRGSWVLDAVSYTPPSSSTASIVATSLPVSSSVASTYSAQLIAGGYNSTGLVYLQFTVSEPLLISPFIFADPRCNNQAMYGIQNMNFVFNIGDASRVWRTAQTVGAATTNQLNAVNLVQFVNSRLLFNFLTSHPSQIMPARNCVPFYELPRYITSVSGLSVAAGSSVQVKTSSLQLNQICDKLIVFCRIPQSSQTNATADSFYPIQGVTINFNNMSGILASATQQDLYRYSVENGSNQSWFEVSGYGNVQDGSAAGGRKLSTVGSVMILEFGKDVNLTEDFYAAGSLGNFNLQLNLTVLNNTSAALTQLEIVLITMNSGVFVCERGTSSTYTGILTKQDVLDASAQEPFFKQDVKRLVGGGWLDSLKSVVGKVLPHIARFGKDQLAKMDNPFAKAGASVLGAMGYGASGGKKLNDRLMK